MGTQTQAKSANHNEEINKSLVKIYSVISKPNYYRPWQHKSYRSAASGFIISEKRILTNAHVVANQTFIEVRRNGNPKRYQARVLSVSHDADLALLTVDNPTFFDNISPLEFGGLPEAQQDVRAYGFPTGGDTLSITRGIVSRVEHVQYTHSSLQFLAGQIDAAINPGNSGGPVISEDGKVVGVAMQGRRDADNIGYLIPVPIIQHFLEDTKDGHYDGFPDPGIIVQDMENDNAREKYQMGNETGVIVRYLLPNASAKGIIQLNDILLAIDGHNIADDGTVEFRPMERTSFGYFVDLHQMGEKVSFTILRQGKKKKVTVPLSVEGVDLARTSFEEYDRDPRYFIFGGIVFCPLSKNLLLEWGPNWRTKAPPELIVAIEQLPTEEREETVLALHILATDINKGYHDISQRIIQAIDGKPYLNFEDFYATIKTSTNTYISFEDSYHNQFLVNRQKAIDNHEKTLKMYRVPQDKSPDLQ
jgi:S1-C subfamily serine protease